MEHKIIEVGCKENADEIKLLSGFVTDSESCALSNLARLILKPYPSRSAFQTFIHIK